VHVHVTGGATLDGREVVTPFTRALLEGHGRIVESVGDDGRLDLMVEVDQLASP
jgi:hypothetical protein